MICCTNGINVVPSMKLYIGPHVDISLVPWNLSMISFYSIGIPFAALLAHLQSLLVSSCTNVIPLAIGSLSISLVLVVSLVLLQLPMMPCCTNVIPLVPLYLSLIQPMELQWFKLVSYMYQVL